MLVACLTSLVAINGKNHVGTGIPQLLPLRSRWNVPKTTRLATLAGGPLYNSPLYNYRLLYNYN